MNLHQLRSFVGVYRAGSILKAAQDLGVAQPAASAHIRALEAELGKPLFTRHARGVHPTPLADELARSIGTRLDGAEAAFARLRTRVPDLAGTVQLAGPPEFMGARMPPVLAAFAATDIDIRLRLGGRDDIYDWLRHDQIDLAITASQPQNPALGSEVIAQERLLMVAAPDFDASGGIAADWPWLAYDQDMPLIRQVLAAGGRALVDDLMLKMCGTVADLAARSGNRRGGRDGAARLSVPECAGSGPAEGAGQCGIGAGE